MIDATKTNERSVLTPDGIGTLKEIAYRGDELKTVKVLFVDPKGNRANSRIVIQAFCKQWCYNMFTRKGKYGRR